MANEEMSPETLQALRGSIAKWEGIVAGTGRNHCSTDCPLCALFNPFENSDVPRHKACVGCPVSARTGHTFCKGSPFEEYEDVETLVEEGDDDGARLVPLAKEELAFLKSLLPRDIPALKEVQP